MYQVHNSATFYVSQTEGDDSKLNGFSPTRDEFGNGPFRTVERALARIRVMRKTGVDRPFTIALTEDYTLSAPLSLTDGIDGITLTSHGGRHRLMGGIRLDGWTWDCFAEVPCLSAPIPKGKDGKLLDFTDLFVNGVRANATRYPKEGLLKVLETEECGKDGVGYHPTLFHSSRWVVPDPEDLLGVENIEDTMIHYYHYWIDEHSPIESYDRESGRLTMAYRSRFTLSNRYGEAHAMLYYLTNVPNTFGVKGEWYRDSVTERVYYIPRDGELPDNIEAIVPVLSHLMDIQGKDIHIRNLELAYTKSDYVSRHDVLDGQYTVGEECYGSDIQSVCWAPGAIVMKNASRCSVSNCELHGLGIHGLELRTACDHVRIEDNRIWDIAAGGIKIEGAAPTDDASLAVSDCLIRGNHISHCGKRFEAGCGIFLKHGTYCEISENEIHDLGYSGISVGFVWGYGENPSFGNLIRRNHIYNIGLGNLSDMGGIYLLGKQSGTVISENRVHDIAALSYGAWGIYLDEGSSYMTVENNVVYRTGKESFHLHYGSHNTVRNNLFFGGCSSCVAISSKEPIDSVLFEQNILVTDGAPIYSTHDGFYSIASRRNLLWDRSRSVPILLRAKNGTEYTPEVWQNVFHNDMGSVIADPLIDGLSSFDFTLSDSSPAHALGFLPLPEQVSKKQ